MSKENNESKNTYFAAGVYKIDFKAAGYPDLIKIAREWAKDPNFKEILVRFVSSDNLGIQFIYISENETGNPIRKYQEELFAKFGKGVDGVYAQDVSEISSNMPGSLPDHGIVVLKGKAQ